MNKSQSGVQLNGSEVAIVGMSCRFPGAANTEQFWRNLRDGVESVSFLSDEELEGSSIDPAAFNDPAYIRAAALLDDIEMFDASFFGLTPKEAEVMDPQQRIFLECAWEALDDAGYNAESYSGRIGLFAGARTNTYLFNLFSNRDALGPLGSFEIGLGNDLAFLTSRASYKLNLRGPSCSVHTACSTSLVAVHLAVHSLLVGECEMALAGGIAINVPQKTGYLYRPGGILSPDGHCRPFDARAQGTIFGSGAGLVVLKRLEDALEHGDTIHAVIKGSAINNDGSPKASFTAPSVYGQAEVIAEALAVAGVEAETITCIEAHGTATALGDPIEVRALTKVFRQSTDLNNFCAIGSVKSNFGHLDAAAGIAGLIKVVLALKHRQLPPSINYSQPNPQIDFSRTPFYVNTIAGEWQSQHGVPRRAGVSSFGVGGTNAHVVLEEAPEIEPPGDSRRWKLLLLSARTESALEQVTENLKEHLESHSDLSLADAAYTLQLGRRAFGFRRAVVCSGREDAIRVLTTLDPSRVSSGYQDTGERKVTFMFSGLGSQFVNMGRELYEEDPEFRSDFDRIAAVFQQELGADISRIVYPPKASGENSASEQLLEQTAIGKAALFTMEYAAARQWERLGVRPSAMIGHSMGEYVAACLAGVMSEEEAARLVAVRGRLMEAMEPGAMLAVSLDERAARSLIKDHRSVEVAALNSRKLTILAGPTGAIDEVESQLKTEDLDHRRLRAPHAFHSAMMEPLIKPFLNELKKIKLRPPRLPYISNVTGTWITEAEATDPHYWARHVRATVRFADGIEELLKGQDVLILEVGPGQTLTRLVRGDLRPAEASNVIASMRHWDQQEPDMAVWLSALGKLWLSGVEIDWERHYARERRRRIGLPAYPFERQRFWIDFKGEPSRGGTVSPYLGKVQELSDWFFTPSWRRVRTPAPFNGAALSGLPPCWLVLHDGSSLADRLVQRLQQNNLDVICARSGSRFAQDGGQNYTINAGAREEYAALFAEVFESGRSPEVIIHTWSLTNSHAVADGIECFEQSQETGFLSLLYLIQGLDSHSRPEQIQICVISDKTQEVGPGDIVAPEKSTLLAACKVIPQEHEQITCRSIDLIVPQAGTEEENRLADQILAEIAANSLDVVCAYRGHQKWVQSYEPAPLGPNDAPLRMLRQGGVYLITGGLGGVGLILAQYLASTVQAKLILTSLSAFPDRQGWDHWLATHDETDVISRRIKKVRAIEELGGEVLIVTADVADEEQMRTVINCAFQRFGELHGVLHTAGLTRGTSVFNPITKIGVDDVRAQFRPKVQGVYVLEKVLRDRELDFCLLFSSNASVLGGLGFITYAASNQFMDAFATSRARNNRGPAWISANWDHWPEETRQYTGYQTSMEQYTMTLDESTEAFRRVATLASGGQVVVSTGDLPARYNLWIKRDSLKALSAVEQAGKQALHPRPSISNAYVNPRNETEQKIAELWQEVLGIERIGVRDSFFDLGGHSLLATRLVGRLGNAFQTDVPLGKFFENPTIEGLAENILKMKSERNDQDRVRVLNLLAQLSEEEVDVELGKRALGTP